MNRNPKRQQRIKKIKGKCHGASWRNFTYQRGPRGGGISIAVKPLMHWATGPSPTLSMYWINQTETEWGHENIRGKNLSNSPFLYHINCEYSRDWCPVVTYVLFLLTFFLFPNRLLHDRRLETTSYINKSKATTFFVLLFSCTCRRCEIHYQSFNQQFEKKTKEILRQAWFS